MSMLCGVSLAVASTASADLVVWTIDPSRSGATGGGQLRYGDVAVADLQAQGPGALLPSLAGTLTTEVDNLLSPSAFRFVSADGTASNTGSWLPGPSGSGTPAPAVLGGFVDGGVGVGQVYAAVRDFHADFRSLDLAVAPDGVAHWTMPSEVSIGYAFTVAYRGVGGLAGGLLGNGTQFVLESQDIFRTPNASPLPASISIDGGLATLTLPIDLTFVGEVFPADAQLGTDAIYADVRLTGAVVATASVPETSLFAPLALAVGALMAGGRLRRRAASRT
jgi:hypothetical protein